MRRIITLTLVTIMAFSSVFGSNMLSVSAATLQDLSFNGTWTGTTGLEVPPSLSLNNITGDTNKIYSQKVDGVFGKSAGDYSHRIYATSAAADNTNGGIRPAPSVITVSAASKVTISAKLATTNYYAGGTSNGRKGITTKLNNDWIAGGDNMVFNLRPDGKIYAYNNYVCDYVAGKWYDFAAVFEGGKNTFDFYVNGVKYLTSAYYNVSGTATLTSINDYRYEIFTKAGKPVDLYTDDVLIYDGDYSSASKTEVTASTALTYVAAEKRFEYPTTNVTAGTLLSGLTLSAGATAKVLVNAKGDQVSNDSVLGAGMVLSVTSSDSRNTNYYPIGKTFFSSEFNAEYSAVNEITNSGYDTLANSAAGTFEFSTVAATKGKSALDRIAKFNLTTQPSSNNNLLLDKNITTITSALINGAVTLEYSFLAEDYRGNRSAQMKLNGSGWTADSSIVDFRSNGQLYILSTSFGTYSLNKWYRIAATLYENSKTLDVWVNGVKYTKQFTNDFSSMNQFRLTNESVGGSASTPAVSYYDDVRISEGAYNPNYNTVSITASNFVKSNNFKKVAIANGTTADQLLTGITTNAKQKTLFNSTLSTQKTGSTALTQGDVLILLSADGYTTHTYNLTDSFLGFEFYNGATKLTNLQAGTITAKIPISNYNGGVNDTAIVALYEGNALKSVQTQSINAQGSSATYNVNTTVDANATKLTVFVWNGLVELKPILEVPIVITK